MNFTLRTLCLLFILLPPPTAAARDLIRLGFTDYPPFVTSGAGGRPQGKVIDFIERNLRDEFQVVWRKLPFTRSKQALENGSIDAYPFLARSVEREAYVHFPSKPYMTVQPLLCSLPQAKPPASEITALEQQLARKTIAHPEGSDKALGLLGRTAIKKIRLPFANYNSRALELLDSKRVDYAMFVTSFGLRGLIDDERIRCRALGDATGVYFAFARGNPLIPRVEAVFRSLEILRY